METDQFIRVDGGEFVMGISQDDALMAKLCEGPPVRISLDPYSILNTPVTNVDWLEFIEDAGYEWGHMYGSTVPEDRLNHPATCVSWFDSTKYCEWLSKRTGIKFSLPTEAQWERACRGTDERMFPWGNEEGMTDDEFHHLFSPTARRSKEIWITHPVRWNESLLSACGCFDMWLNVSEWCADWFDDEDLEHIDGAHNPQGPEIGTSKSFRGGNYIGIGFPRCSARGESAPEERHPGIGFRIVGPPDIAPGQSQRTE